MAEIGARLREARMRARVDINEVETRTKIRAKYLRAMENEEWELLPGDVYVRSFLRTYGEFLGLDTRQLLDDFRREYEAPADHEPPPIVPQSRESQRHRDRGRAPRSPGGRRIRGVAPWTGIVVVLVAVGVVLYLVGRNNGSPSSDTGTHSTASTHRTHAPHRRRTRTTRTAPAAPSVVKLSLVPTGQVYVCLVDGSGRKLIPGQIYAPGQTIPVQSGAKLLLTLGNASVTLKANGVPIPVSPSASSIGFQFTPGHHVALPASRQPSCT